MKKITLLFILFFIGAKLSNAQEPFGCAVTDTMSSGTKDLTSCGILANYKLDKTNTYQFSPVYKPNVQIHVFQYSATDPRNFTTADLGDLNQIMIWINDIYKNIQAPTRPVIPAIEEETDSRIQFNFLPVEFIVDPVAWDGYTAIESPLVTLVSFSATNIVDVAGTLPFSPINCIKIEGSLGNDGVYKVIDAIYDAGCDCSQLTISGILPIFPSAPGGNVTLMKNGIDKVCSNDIFTAYHSSSLNTIHVYYVSQSNLCSPATGCGGDQYYCKLRGSYPISSESYYAIAQLTAHEIGHCLGLYHTADINTDCSSNTVNPTTYGITDLPTTDCMGFIPCDNTTTSNNVMGYNKCRNYLSPLQIAYLRQRLSTDVSKINYLKECQYDPTETVTITGTVTWDNKEIVGGDIIIPAGSTLNIQCRVNMAEGSVIKVYPGGKLNVNGGHLTNLCGKWWQGIEAIGNPLSSSQLSTTQAHVIMDNATIENAYVGIRGGEVDATYVTKFNQGGAILQIKNSTFKNNWWDIQVTPYHRYKLLPSGEKIEINNISYITNNTFINDSPLTNPSHTTPTSRVSVWETRGIKILGNTFENTRTDITAEKKGVGITLIDANNTIIGEYCSSLISPCPLASEDRNIFKNLYIGVEPLLGTGADNITIDKNDFINCVYQIKSAGSAYLKITRNKFYIPFGTYEFPGYSDGFGIFSDGNYGFNIEENSFFPYHPLSGTGAGQSVGVFVNNSSAITSGNNIYRNDFGDLSNLDLTKRGVTLGVQTAGNNSTLPIDCNRFYRSDFGSSFSTKIDIHIAKGSLANQGDCDAADPKKPQANEFYSNTPCGMVFNNAQIWKNFLVSGLPQYNSYSVVGFNDGCNNWGTTSNDCTGSELLPYDRNAACPPTLSGTPTGITVTKALSDYTFYKDKIAALKTTIDGGNTQTLINYINTTSSNALLKSHLLSYAPYLSDEVLVTLINKNSPKPAVWVITDVLAACAPPTETVLKALLNKTPSLPPTTLRNFFIASAPVRKDVMILFINKTGIPPSVIKDVAIANSPLFSDELVAIINLTPKLSATVLNDILLKNTPLTQLVLDALNSRSPALPQWVWDNINSSTYIAPHPDTRVKTYNAVQQIMNTINYNNTQKLYNLSWLVSHYLDSNYVDSALSILNLDGSIEAMCALVPVQIERKKLIDADINLTFIYGRAIYKQTIDADDPEAADLLNFCLFHNTLKIAKGNPQGYFSLTAPQRAELLKIANTDSPISANAKAVLNFINGVNPYEPAYPIDEESNPRHFQNQQKVQPSYDVKLHCFPNPTNGNVSIEISGLNEAPNGQLLVVDVAGKIIKTINVKDENSSISINDLSSGLYYLVFYQNNVSVANERLIVIK